MTGTADLWLLNNSVIHEGHQAVVSEMDNSVTISAPLIWNTTAHQLLVPHESVPLIQICADTSR